MTIMEVQLFKPELIIQALRKSGYKTTPNALAELIDNSIQAGATQVHVYMFSEGVQLRERISEQVTKIAVLDNGKGMDKETLWKSIGFGNGERLGATQGLGKFGMGLSNSSIAFADETDVYSWQDGLPSAMKTTLSVTQVKAGSVVCPEPKSSSLDSQVLEIADNHLGRKGTLIVWGKLNINPKRFDALSSHTELLIGRIYRNFIHSGKVAIEVHDILNGVERKKITIKPNDPLYLMAPSATPLPYDNEAMFQLFEDMVEPERTIQFTDPETNQNFDGNVRVKISHVKPGLRNQWRINNNNLDAGKAKFGQHAKKNVGFSICREGRELDLDDSFAKPSEATERWWGVEIDFDASLDDLFGVTSNKQEALILKQFHHWSWKDEADPGETETSFLLRSVNDGDPRAPLMTLFRDIENALGVIRRLLGADVEGGRRPRGGQGGTALPGPEAVATDRAAEREELGNRGEAFNDELPLEEEVKRAAEDDEVAEEGVEHAVEVLRLKGRFAIEIGYDEESLSFFLIRRQRGMLLVIINSAHPFYSEVYEKLFLEPVEEESDQAKIERLLGAQDAFKLSLLAWARMEDEAPTRAQQFRDTRADWGRILRHFLGDSSKSEE